MRLIHKPTGLVVEMQDERSQLQNKLRAKQVLIARLYEAEVERQRTEREAESVVKSAAAIAAKRAHLQLPTGARHRPPHRLQHYNLPSVMDGELDVFIDQLATQQQAEQLAAGGPE